MEIKIVRSWVQFGFNGLICAKPPPQILPTVVFAPLVQTLTWKNGK